MESIDGQLNFGQPSKFNHDNGTSLRFYNSIKNGIWRLHSDIYALLNLKKRIMVLQNYFGQFRSWYDHIPTSLPVQHHVPQLHPKSANARVLKNELLLSDPLHLNFQRPLHNNEGGWSTPSPQKWFSPQYQNWNICRESHGGSGRIEYIALHYMDHPERHSAKRDLLYIAP